jgi:hypothetical protein
VTPLHWFLGAAAVLAAGSIAVVVMAALQLGRRADDDAYAAFRDEFTGRLD